jgi:predicted nuclease of restriction endonuclease-like (RecB) superfamily
MKEVLQTQNSFYHDIKSILQTARDNAYKSVNFIMVEAYWNIGKKIVEVEQNGETKAKYGSKLISELSKQLTVDFGSGFSARNIRNMRQFYNCFPIWQTVSAKLSWSHYLLILKIENEKARDYYIQETIASNWSVRALERQINSLYYERLISSQEKQPVIQEAKENTKNLQLTAKDIIKDPYVLEFLDLKDNKSFRENELESALLEKIQEFLLELGRGFAFVSRQKRIKTQTSDFYIDLVFYNYLLKCFVLVDLKIGKLSHQDIGQIDMYVNMYDDLEKNESDNPTIGMILCTDKDETIVKYSHINSKDNLFVSKYQLYLPSEEEFKREIERKNWKNLDN